MKIRRKDNHAIKGDVSGYNTFAVSPAEVIVIYEDGSASSEYLRDWEPEPPHQMNDLTAYLSVQEHGFERWDGRASCPQCGKMVRDHPPVDIDYEGNYVQLCTGTVVKT